MPPRKAAQMTAGELAAKVGLRIVSIAGSRLDALKSARTPPGALAALSERFCPACLVALIGDLPNLCPECGTYWNVRRDGP